MEKDYGCQQGSDVEMEDATPRPRDFQPNADDLQPYETPVVLKKAKHHRRTVIEDSEVESDASQMIQADADREDRKMTSKSGRVRR
jgi:hypothetical protein